MNFSDREKRYVSVKALKGYATELVQRGVMWELAALQRLSFPRTGPPSDHCLRLISHFIHPGKAQDGDHLCLVTQLLAGDVRTLQVNMKNNAFPLPLAKRVLLHILRGIEYVHRHGVTHTDLKHDNILFDLGRLTTADVSAIVEADPPRLNPPEESWDSTVQSAVSQPLPLPSSVEDAMTRTYLIADFGSGKNDLMLFVDTPADLAFGSPIIYRSYHRRDYPRRPPRT